MLSKNNESYVEVTSRGQTMRGMLHRPPDFSTARRYPAIMLWHGFTGARVEGHRMFVKAARRLAAAGIVTARFDFIGSGESDGDFVDVTPETEIADARQVLAWLAAQPGVDRTRLATAGLSLGGLVSACVAGRSGKVRALVLWAATAHMGQRMRERATPESTAFLAQHGFVEMSGTRVGRAFLETAARLEPLREVQRHTGAALVIHGTADATVPVAEAHDYAAALELCHPALHLIDGADHTFNRSDWESELIETTCAWLQANL